MSEQDTKVSQDIYKIPEQTFIEECLGDKLFLREEKHIGIKVGQLEMEFKLSGDESELLMRNRYSGISKLLKEQFESDWHKTAWPAGGDNAHLSFTLRLPDRPVVLKPDVVQRVFPGQTVAAYCTIPLMIELNVCGSKLGEYPIVVLSKTWFGEPDAGVLGYSLKSQVLSSKDKLPRSRVHALCTLEIINHSTEMLCFERLCLQTGYMGLFKVDGDKGINTSRCRLIYAGKERMEKISYLNPPAGQAFEIISPPRLKQGQNLLFKSFKTI